MPDWFGEKEKRKHDDPVRERLWIVGSSLLASLVVVAACGVLAVLIAAPLAQVVREVQKTATPAPVAVQVTATTSPAPRPTTPPAPITATPFTVELADRLHEYRTDGAFIRTLDMTPDAGYRFAALYARVDTLYTTVNGQFNADPPRCIPGEGVWIIDLASGLRRDTISNPRLVAPQRIVLDDAGNAYVLAWEDVTGQCTAFSRALFRVSAAKQITGTFRFETIRADDLAITADGHIFVSLSGFAGGTIQPHLLELVWNGTKFEQVGEYASDRYDVRFRALAAAPGGTLLYLIRTQPESGCVLYALTRPPVKRVIDGTFTSPVFASAPPPPAPVILKLRDLAPTECATELAVGADGTLFGLGGETPPDTVVLRWSAALTDAPNQTAIPRLKLHGFARISDGWIFASQTR